MFVYNVRLSSGKLFKCVLAVMLIIVFIITGISIYKTFPRKASSSVSDNVYQITPNNYTNILKAVHDNLDNYIGQKIAFSGYVYRVYDLQPDEFVLARDMVINSNFDTLVVGFLCQSDNAANFDNGTWVNIVGEIKKGYYHGDIPIIEITSLEEVPKPSDSYVYPPDEYYIPTSSLLYDNP